MSIKFRHLALLFIIFFMNVYSAPAQERVLNFSPGQMWSIKSAHPTTAKIIIGRIEPWKGKVAIHVSIVDIPIPSDVPTGPTSVDQMPFDRAALSASVDRLLAVGVPLPSGFEHAYEHWHSEKGASIFTIPVSKAIEFMFEAINKKSIA